MTSAPISRHSPPTAETRSPAVQSRGETAGDKGVHHMKAYGSRLRLRCWRLPAAQATTVVIFVEPHDAR